MQTQDTIACSLFNNSPRKKNTFNKIIISNTLDKKRTLNEKNFQVFVMVE